MTTHPQRLITAQPAPPDTREPLTKAQSKALACCVNFLQDNDTLPTARALAGLMGHVNATAWQHLKRLEQKGYLVRNASNNLMLADRPAATSGVCGWKFDDEDSNTWRSACCELWSFLEGGPAENRVSYCHHCGGRVHLIKAPEEVAHG